MNKLTKIALGLCAVKVGIETTKYKGKYKGNIWRYVNDVEKSAS